MHIAVCDDNVADRRQTERLLKRESDARLQTSGVLYVDSFGHSEALLNAPMLYDLFFIDMTQGACSGMELARSLRAAGVTSPIALCSSVIDYSVMEPQPDNVYHLCKPLKAARLASCIDDALAVRSRLARTYEIRCEQETHYVSADSIVLVSPQGHLARILFEDGSELKMLGSLTDFFHLTESCKKFLFAKKTLLVNRDFIASYSIFRLRMKNGQTFRINPSDWIYLKKNCPLPVS